MTATAHALVGGAIAISVRDPLLGITLAAASHPLLDMIPHWDFGWGWRKKTKIKLFLEAGGDLLVGTLLTFLIFGSLSSNLWYFFGCIFASVVWDIAEAPYWFLNWRFAPFSWIYSIQSKMQGKTKTMWGGIATQVATVITIVYVLNQLTLY